MLIRNNFKVFRILSIDLIGPIGVRANESCAALENKAATILCIIPLCLFVFLTLTFLPEVVLEFFTEKEGRIYIGICNWLYDSMNTSAIRKYYQLDPVTTHHAPLDMSGETHGTMFYQNII